MVTRALLAVGALALGGCGSTPGPAAPRPTVLHRDGLSFTLPVGWHAAPRTLTPHLVDPREVLTAGTGRMASGGTSCAHMPSAALAAMNERDVLVTVQERAGDVSGFAERPPHFDAAAAG